MDESVRDDRLYQPLRDFAQEAVQLLQREHPSAAPVFFGDMRWVRTDESTFQLCTREEPNWRLPLVLARNRLKALRTYPAARDALVGDSRFSGQIDTLVGTAEAARRVEADEILLRPVAEMARKAGRFAFDETVMAEVLGCAIADARRSFVRQRIVVPLVGLAMDSPVVFAEGFGIERLSDDEIARCLNAGYLRSAFGTETWEPELRDVWGVRYHYEMPKLAGDATFENRDLPSAFGPREEGLDAILHVVQFLRTLKPGRFSTPGYIAYSIDLPGSGTTYAPLGPSVRRHGVDFTVESAEFPALRESWEKYRIATQCSVIAAAARRFGYAIDRYRADDRIVDLMIAAESLFLTDIGNAQDKGELRYRLSVRGAFYVTIEGATRRQVFGQFKRGYDARSAIVHGGDPDSKTLKSINGAAVPISEFAASLEMLVRAALTRAIREHERDRASIADWDALVLGA